ncbi:MAG: SNF2-related protein [Planctomycetota bacterium]|nr:SNF2-related protein [Planctomycetota bacterium]
MKNHRPSSSGLTETISGSVFEPGDRIEIQFDRYLAEIGLVPIDGPARNLLGAAAETNDVILRDQQQQFVKCRFDRDAGVLESSELKKLFLPGGYKRLLLELLQRAPLTFSIIGPQDSDLAQASPIELFSPKVTGGVTVRFNSSDRAILEESAKGQFGSKRQYDLNLSANRLALCPRFDQFLCFPFLRDVVIYEHQTNTVRTVLGKLHGRALLCDEVGLGKTIEAGMVLLELLLRRLAKRILILTPPSLVAQWEEEMRRKFNLSFVTYDSETFRACGSEGWEKFERVVASFHTAKQPQHATAIEKIHYDFVIIDEAHHFRNSSTRLWQFANNLKKKFILLLTATPVQNNLEELHNLITLLSPGQLGTLKAFRREHMVRGNKLLPKDLVKLRRALSEVMIRNRRATVGIQMTRRFAKTIQLDLNPDEKKIYQDVSAFLREQLRKSAGINRMTLRTVQMELGSSPDAAALTLKKMGNRLAHLLPQLEKFNERIEGLKTSAKSLRLLELVQSWPEKLIVFTQYRATQQHLAKVLGEAGIEFVLFHGALGRMEKEDVIKRFRTTARILVSSESGAEGRNLQFCRAIANYDLPWNPMRIEQRIGRVSRVGQTQDVYVFNFSANETIEAAILHLLDAKINMFQMVIGEIEMILGILDEEQDFEDVVLETWVQSSSEDEFKQRMQTLGEKLISAKEEYLRFKEHDEKLFGDAFETSPVRSDMAEHHNA